MTDHLIVVRTEAWCVPLNKIVVAQYLSSGDSALVRDLSRLLRRVSNENNLYRLLTKCKCLAKQPDHLCCEIVQRLCLFYNGQPSFIQIHHKFSLPPVE